MKRDADGTKRSARKDKMFSAMGESWKYIEVGGSTMYVLLLLSIVALIAIFYGLLTLRRRALFPAALVSMAEKIVTDDQCEVAESMCRTTGGALAEILITVIATRQLTRDEADLLVEGAGRRVAHQLSRSVAVLETIAAISPLLGLLGTVLGMYEVFENIAQATAVNEMARLSDGIAKALITTIAGLVVAVPAFVAHGYFTRRVEDLVMEMERLAVELMLRLRN